MSPRTRVRVLVADDDRAINELICQWLRDITIPDFEPVPVYSYAAAASAVSASGFDLLLLDRVLGDGDGVSLLRAVRAKAETRHLPVIIFSGLGKEKDVIHGLTQGADEYLPKPCSEELFRARLLAVLRRNRAPATSGVMDGPGFRFDPIDGRLFVGGAVEHLEPKESMLLLLFLRRPNVIHSAHFLCREAWGKAVLPHNTLETRLSSLRRKLGARASCLETVRGAGYRLLA